MNPIIKNLESEYTTRELPEINTGDTVRVSVKIIEGNKERLQAYEGTVIAQQLFKEKVMLNVLNYTT